VLNTIFAKPYTLAEWQPIRFVSSSQPPPTFIAHGDAQSDR
jgi:hypothetical protein